MRKTRLRWAIFSQSIVSAAGNPDAYLFRGVGRFLAHHGHEATFYEERANSALRSLLQTSGARALTQFRTLHPEITYRTVEPRVGADLVEWLTRTLATVDIALVGRRSRPDVAMWVGRLTRAHLHTHLIDSGLDGEGATSPLEDIEPQNFSGVWIGPAVPDETYAGLVPNRRIHRFGPLPEILPISDEAAARLVQGAANDLIEGILRVSRQEPSSRPNGRIE